MEQFYGIVTAFENLGVETDVGDILVWGASIEEHDEYLMKTLQQCEEINLTLNRGKFEFQVNEVIYIGHKLTADGVKPNKQKVEAIKRMHPPKYKKRTERLPGHSDERKYIYTTFEVITQLSFFKFFCLL